MPSRITDLAVEGSYYVRVRNESGAAIAAGTLIAITGYNATEGLLLVDEADKGTAAKPAFAMLPSELADQADGDAVGDAIITADTTGRAIGDPAYLGANGALSFALDDDASIAQEVGRVVTVGASGRVYFLPKTAIARYDHYAWVMNGNLGGGNVQDGIRVVKHAGDIVRVTMAVRDSGGTGTTIVDLNHGAQGSAPTTVYTTQGNRPTIAGGLGLYRAIEVALPNTVAVVKGNMLAIDIDSTANSSVDASLEVVVRRT
jgi:hypothetical protein